MEKSGEIATFNRFELIDPEGPLLNTTNYEETSIIEEEINRKPEEDLPQTSKGRIPRSYTQ